MAILEQQVTPIRQWQVGERDRPQSYHFTANPDGWEMAMLVMDGPEQYTETGRTIEWHIDVSDDNTNWRPMASTQFTTGSVPRYIIRRMLVSLSDALIGKYFSVRTVLGGDRLRYGITLYIGTQAEIDAKITELQLSAPTP